MITISYACLEKFVNSHSRLVLWTVLGLLLAASVPLEAQRDWRFANPDPTANRLTGLAHGGGQFVAVDSSGGILISADGQDWEQAVAGYGGKRTLNDVFYGDGRFVAVGVDFRTSLSGQALFATSTDGRNWTFTASQTSNAQLTAVLHANGVWVASGSQGTFFRSSDGQTWTRGTAANSQSAWFSSITYGDGQFAAVTQLFVNNQNQAILFTSPDGQTWTRRDTGVAIGGIGPIRYANGRWVVVANSQSPFGSKILTSTDLSTWNTEIPVVTGGTTFEGLAYGNDRWVATASTVGWSSDGTTWNSVIVNPASPASQGVAMHDVIFADGEFWAVGDRGVIRRSADGVAWTALSSGPLSNLLAVATNGSTLVAVGEEGAILTSADSLAWTAQSSGLSNPTFRDVTFAQGKFLATGSHTATSPDGITWTASGAVAFSTSNSPNAVTHGAGIWVLVGSQNNYSWSSDGQSWTAATTKPPGFKGLNDVAYGNGVFVAAGGDFQNGLLVSSPNGQEWTDRTPAGSQEFYKVVFGNGVFVAAGNPKSGSGYAHVLVSPDGITWTPANGNLNFYNASSLIFDGARFLILDRDYTRVSTDGLNWRHLVRELPVSNSVAGGLLHNDHYVVVGWDGLIMVSPRDPLAFADFLSGDWAQSNWFGFYYLALAPWLYHDKLGWLYPLPVGDALYLYRPAQGWLYTNETLFPFAFSFTSAQWVWFDRETGLSYDL